ncbi:MAG: UbiD family decarboxylase domain-containing protein, partial [Salinigranum sp.]
RTRAETVDLEVPANAEYVVDGEIDPERRVEEGPFGEFAGYMGEVFEKPVLSVTGVTHRRDPMFYGYISQMPPSESTMIQSVSNAAMYHAQLTQELGHPAVSDVYIDQTYGGLLAHAIVQMDPQYPSHAMEVGRTLADVSALKRVTVVNADVDIRDPRHVDWAMNSRFNPQRDTLVIEDVYIPAVLDPSVQMDPKGRPMTSKLVVDATEEMEMEDGEPTVNLPDLSIPPRDLMEAAKESWAEAGLPELQVKRRMELMLERHPGDGADTDR